MKILVIGSGGREHAVCEQFKASKMVQKLFALPGNAGIASIAECITDIKAENHAAIIDFCHKNAIDLVFIGPEQPLVDGLVDDLRSAKINVFGPSKYCAQLEGSKDFMKQIAAKYNIPTAKYRTFSDEKGCAKFAQELGFPCVIKADGLAAGKGVVIAQNEKEFAQTIQEFFAGKFGTASKKIIVEEFLEGLEVSYFVICDGKTFLPLGFAHDHKKVGEGETGLNTGGMGTFAPSPFIDEALENAIIDTIVKPTLQAFTDSGNPYSGVLFAGIILTKQGPKLLEHNVRFGDPETQIILPRITSDFAELIMAAAQEKLCDAKIEFDNKSKFVCVVMCAKGYPENYQKGQEIRDLEKTSAIKGVKILHAGTKLQNGKIIANGGRVLNIVAKADNFREARQKAYEAIDLIDWQGGFVRRDIAKKVEDL